MTGHREIRERLRDLLSRLHDLDTETLEVLELLPLPPDAQEMWELQLPTSFVANVHGALESVRESCLAEAISVLRQASTRTQPCVHLSLSNCHPEGLNSEALTVVLCRLWR